MTGQVLALPYNCNLANQKTIVLVASSCIDAVKCDWDSFETSWDFTRHPLVRSVSTVAEAFGAWATECNDRFQQLKANEEEPNRIFIDIYGLQDELTPEVEDKDVTVRCSGLGRGIRSLLSYAVGCIFGRYSLDVPVWPTPGDFNSVYRKDRLVGEKGNPITLCGISISVSKDYTYISHDGTWIEAAFPVDGDNILPLTDESYLEDDIISRLCQWLRAVYGPDTLEENLDFITKALGIKDEYRWLFEKSVNCLPKGNLPSGFAAWRLTPITRRPYRPDCSALLVRPAPAPSTRWYLPF